MEKNIHPLPLAGHKAVTAVLIHRNRANQFDIQVCETAAQPLFELSLRGPAQPIRGLPQISTGNQIGGLHFILELTPKVFALTCNFV